MFGYLKPDYPYLYKKDETLYQAMYCGVCKSIGKCLGQTARFSLTYDIAFMSSIIHNILGVDVKIEKEHCVARWIRKTPVAQVDDVSLLLANVNVILAKYKASDDLTDEKKGKFKNAVISKGYKKAKKLHPEVDNIVKTTYENLLKLEKENSSSVDMVSDCFAEMLKRLSTYVLKDKANSDTEELFYLIGKWIYLIDAVDDYDKDVKSGNYNVFKALYNLPTYENVKTSKIEDITFIFGGIFMRISEVLPRIKFHFNKDLILNILTRGMPMTTKRIINRENTKTKQETKND